MARGDLDSKIVHRETLDNEDAIFAALDAAFGSLDLQTPAEKEQ